MKDIFYPKFSREQAGNCKLSDKQILEIQEMRKLGLSYMKISRIFNISYCTSYYWCQTDDYRKKWCKKNNLKDLRTKTEANIRHRNTIDKKKKIMPEQFSEYSINTQKEWRDNNREQYRITQNKWYHNNRSKEVRQNDI